MVDESTSYHEQAIATLNNGEVVETHMENRKEEQIEVPQALRQAKGEEVCALLQNFRIFQAIPHEFLPFLTY
jgi:hypothetical protein